jgi:hypothetical protein
MHVVFIFFDIVFSSLYVWQFVSLQSRWCGRRAPAAASAVLSCRQSGVVGADVVMLIAMLIMILIVILIVVLIVILMMILMMMLMCRS